MGKAAFWAGCVVAALVLVAPCPGAVGQEPPLTPREKELLELVQELQGQVREMGERLERLERERSSSEPAALVERVERLEESTVAGKRGPTDFRVFWKDGLRFETEDERYKLQIGGRIQHDIAFFEQSSELKRVFGDQEDGTEFRRTRLFVKGLLHDRIEFKVQWDFAGGDSDLKDVYLAFLDIPVVGAVKIGHFKEPFSLEELTSSKYITFMERALPSLFAPARNAGIMIGNDVLDSRLTWALGVFRDTNDYGMGIGDGDYAWTARVTGLPWYKDEGRRLLHLGLAYSMRNTDGTVRLRQRPEIHLSQFRYVDTRRFTVDDMDLLGAELAFVYGPFSAQAEYTHASLDTRFLGDRDFSGFYAQASYFLTGEHRPYSTSKGTFGRIKPKHPFRGEDHGWGAWELAVRYSMLDLDDGFFRGGEEEDWTVGANWYLNSNVRLTLNYVHGEIDDFFYDGDVDILGARFQVEF